MLLNSDAARIPLEDKSIHCVTTSPPYWGLRKYSGEQGRGMFPNLGLEPTPGEFVHNMVMIFREVRRVLRDDGVVWLNLGDSFSAAGWESSRKNVVGQGSFDPADRKSGKVPGLAAGNLMLMPHRVAIALQDDGWIVRNDVVWFKRNPMPESLAGWRFERSKKIVGNDPRGNESEKRNATLGKPPQRDHNGRDFARPEYEYGDYQLRKGSWRHTRAHEFIFMLTKKMQYWSNQEAVREIAEARPMKNPDGWDTGKGTHGTIHRAGREKGNHTGKLNLGRNPRSVLDVPTAPYKGAHYATFPPNLIAPLIRATCPRWACPVCGQGWSPMVEKGAVTGIPGQGGDGYKLAKAQSAIDDPNIKGRSEGWMPNHFIPSNIKEYRPTCSHEHTIEEAVPGIVLDPFIGSGTTGAVARELQRRWIGLDISMEYIDLQAKVRTKSGSPSNELEGLPLFGKELV